MGTCRPAKPHSNLPRLATCTFGHLVGTVRFKIVQSERLTLKRKWVFFVRLQGFLIVNTFGRNQSMPQILYIGIVTKRRQDLRLLLLVGCSYACPTMSKHTGATLKINQNEKFIQSLGTENAFSSMYSTKIQCID